MARRANLRQGPCNHKNWTDEEFRLAMRRKPLVCACNCEFEFDDGSWAEMAKAMQLPITDKFGVKTRAIFTHLVEDYLERKEEFSRDRDLQADRRTLNAIASERDIDKPNPAELTPDVLGILSGRMAQSRDLPDMLYATMEGLKSEIIARDSTDAELATLAREAKMLGALQRSRNWPLGNGADVPSLIFLSHVLNALRFGLGLEISIERDEKRGPDGGDDWYPPMVHFVRALYKAAGENHELKTVYARLRKAYREMRSLERCVCV